MQFQYYFAVIFLANTDSIEDIISILFMAPSTETEYDLEVSVTVASQSKCTI